MTLGDIKVNDDFVSSKIVFMTTGGATAKTTFGGKTVSQEYVYWFAEDDPEDGEGWYLSKDGDGEVNQNGVALPMGSGFLVSRMGSEVDAALLYSGEVKTTPVTKDFPNSGFSLVGNCSPTAITLGDITPNEDFVSSKIVFMTTGGATAKTTFGGKTVSQEYVYWTAEDDPEDGAGWYLSKDGDGESNFNSIPLAAGEGFMVSRMGSEADATITIPSAL